MKFFNPLKSALQAFSSTSREPSTFVRRVRAERWDATRPSDDLREHWRWTDSKSIDAALSPDVRRKFRERARYEIANNSYAKGVALAISNAVVGSGPRLQVLIPENKKLASQIEWDFCEWAEQIRLAEKLRAMRFARFQDGESFALLCRNPSLDGPVQLDVAPFDAERVASEYGIVDPRDVDGIKLDEFGNPVSYRVLTRHPGGTGGDSERFGDRRVRNWSSWVTATVYDACDVIHWFRRETSEQHRGLTELHASLVLFALLRRYTLAVVAAAETAADIATVMYSDGAMGDGVPKGEQPQPYDEFEITRGGGMVLPETWKITQLKAEQPTTTYGEFKREILGEIGRSLQIPFNLIAGNSSDHNYASGRLDHHEFQKAIRLDQSAAAINVMRPIFRSWWREYALTRRIRGAELAQFPVTAWYWDGFEHVDPTKEANAQAIRLASGTTNLSIEYGKVGLDWEDQVRQKAREEELMRELGLTSNAQSGALKNDKNNDESESNSNDKDDDENN